MPRLVLQASPTLVELCCLVLFCQGFQPSKMDRFEIIDKKTTHFNQYYYSSAFPNFKEHLEGTWFLRQSLDEAGIQISTKAEFSDGNRSVYIWIEIREVSLLSFFFLLHFLQTFFAWPWQRAQAVRSEEVFKGGRVNYINETSSGYYWQIHVTLINESLLFLCFFHHGQLALSCL